MVYLGRGKDRIPITWESLIWFAVLTTVGTMVGTWAYVKWVAPYQLPPGAAAQLPPTV